MSFEAIVLAGGLGTRLRQTVPGLPKVLAPVAGRPFIEHVLAELVRGGCVRAVLAVGYLHDMVTQHLGRHFDGLELDYSVEDVPLGTGGAIRLASRMVRRQPFFVLNGDTWLDLDHGAMLAKHRSANAVLSIAVRRVPDVSRFGAVLVEGDRVVRMDEKGNHGPGLINAGIYLMDSTILHDPTLVGAFSFERDLLSRRLPDLRPLAYETTGRFIDIGVAEDYAAAQTLLAAS